MSESTLVKMPHCWESHVSREATSHYLVESFIRAPSTNVGGGLFFLACPSVRGHSNSVIFNQISSKFHTWINQISSKFHIRIVFINLSLKFEYWLCLTSDNQDGRQNGRHLSISAVVVTLTQSFLIRFLPNYIYELLSSTFCTSSNMGFVQHPIIKMADKMATTYQCPLWRSL